MYYFSLDIDKWMKRTHHLLPEEEGIYLRLINHYYDSEKPLPLDVHQLARRLNLAAYRETMQQILAEFFIETPDGYTNDKCDRNIAEYHRKGDISRVNGAKGGRPKPSKNPETTQQQPSKNPAGTQQVTSGVPRANPDHNLKEPESVNLQTCKPVQEEAAAAAMPKQDACPYQKIIDLYHEILPQHPRVKIITNKRKSHIKARWMNGANGLPFWTDYFETVAKSKFLTGKVTPQQGRKVFIADIDFLIREDVLVKTQEGKYHE